MPADAPSPPPRPGCSTLELIDNMLVGPALDPANQSAWDALLLEAQEQRDGAAAQVGRHACSDPAGRTALVPHLPRGASHACFVQACRCWCTPTCCWSCILHLLPLHTCLLPSICRICCRCHACCPRSARPPARLAGAAARGAEGPPRLAGRGAGHRRRQRGAAGRAEQHSGCASARLHVRGWRGCRREGLHWGGGAGGRGCSGKGLQAGGEAAGKPGAEGEPGRAGSGHAWP